jgi:dihydrodipicolinate synthase/N-acetylneuraminate lyase
LISNKLESISLLLIVYNAPGRTGINIEPATVNCLAEIDNLIGPLARQAAMALMGLIEPVWRLPLVSRQAENLAKIRGFRESAGLLQRAYARS